MLYRPYGRTGKSVSVLAAGGMRYPDPHDIDRMAEIPLAAARAGVNYFDTAPGYSEDRSEEILATALREMRRQGLTAYVATKTWATDRDTFRRHLESSLRRLGVERIDFYHAWAVNSPESYEKRRRGGVFEEMAKAKEEGLVGHVVCSSHMAGPEIAAMVRDGVFEGILLGFNAVNFVFRAEGIRAAAERGMGVVVMNPLYGGMLTEHPGRFAFLKRGPEEPILDAALHFVLGWPGVTAALVGFRSVEDVRTAVEAVERFRPFTEEELERLAGNLRRDFDGLCTTCGYCRGCPQGVPVMELMESFNLIALGAKAEEVFDRLKWHWGVKDLAVLEDCVECRLCEERCNQHIPVLERFRALKSLPRPETAEGG